ncbi:FAD-dependent oxidoreductase [Bradyrhizobium sp.]|uniref:FAD-dependent oxidoreductase n=1 Tax=Bradyrhizobium sp. TaxID=376 RepID=UPI003C24E894
MIRNGKDISSGSVVSTQVCIIGSGPAGITAAWCLQKAGIKVTLIEGSRDYGTAWKESWPDKVLLYNGVADGLFATNEPEFLILPYVGHTSPAWERERVFGGTSAHWGGQSHWAGILQAEVPHLAGFDTEMYQFVGPNYRNFATRTFDGKTIGESPVDVILNASLLNIDHTNGIVKGLRVASMDVGSSPRKATEFKVQADVYVLACGAVANAHQLLLSNAGNEHDQVGRYFMCHPLAQGSIVRITKPYLSNAQSRLMNGQTPNGDPWHDENRVGVTGRFSPDAEQQKKLGIGSCWFWSGGGQYYFEMAPNPDSRVRLADTHDPVFGQQQTRITWELTPLDETTYNQSTQLFKAAVNHLNGDVSFQSWASVKSQLVDNGHHIGTTRMSSDPTKGVVDANLKVHSLDNLYVAGSSVFATAGISNPTFTIITLSIRLAEHLSKTLGS